MATSVLISAVDKEILISAHDPRNTTFFKGQAT